MARAGAIWTLRAFVASCLVAVCALCMANSAYAADAPTVHGCDYHGTGSVVESGDIDVLEVEGVEGDHVFVSIMRDGRLIAQNLVYTLSAENGNASGAKLVGVVTIAVKSLDVDALSDGSYTVAAYADRDGKQELFSGSIYGVYGDLNNDGDTTTRLIGTQTVAKGESASDDFKAPATLYSGDDCYAISNDGEAVATNPLHFSYEKDAPGDVDGVLRYVDANGAELKEQAVREIPYDGFTGVSVPAIIEVNGTYYRTVTFENPVMLRNPGQTERTIRCIELGQNYGGYSGIVQMVEKGNASNVVASDTLGVSAETTYTAPAVIYKTESGKTVTYTIASGEDQVVRFSPDTDKPVDGAVTKQVAYTRDANASGSVTFRLIDGSKSADDSSRVLETQNVEVTKGATVSPSGSQVTKDGVTYTIVGKASDYAYTYGSGKIPVVDVYYTPEGYATPEDYTVTVNYVNYANNAIVGSNSFTSSADDEGAVAIDAPKSFDREGVTYLKLDGQDDMMHSFYSGIDTYTVYYRDSNDNLSPSNVSRVRVVYDGTNTTVRTTTTGTRTTTGANNGGTTGANNGGTQLNTNRQYTTVDGQNSNGTLTNNRGVDSNTERIADDTTPLASADDIQNGTSQTDQNAQAGPDGGLIAALVAALLAAIGVVIFMVMRKRSEEEQN